MNTNNSNNTQKKVFLVIIGGISGGGKTCLASEIIRKIGDKKKVCIIDMDGYYDDLPDGINGDDWNWDSPKAFDKGIHLLVKHLEILKSGGSVKIPKHDYSNYKMIENSIEISDVDVIIIEGILTFYFEQLRNLADMKIYVNCDDDTALARRLIRDVNERGYDMDLTIRRYHKFVKKAAEKFIKPFRKMADFEIPNYSKDNMENHLAADMASCFIVQKVS